MKWSLDSLERSCRKVLASSHKINLGELPPSFCADVTLEDKPRIRVDGHKVGVQTAVLHELIHVVLNDELEPFNDEIEELIVEAVEDALDRKINNSRRRVRWWRTKIEERLRK